MPTRRLFQHARIAQAGAWLLACGVAAWQYPHAVAGVFWGGLLMAINMQLMGYLAEHLRHGRRRKGIVAAALGAKFALLMAGVVGIMQGFDPDLVGFAAGLATFFAGMGGAALSAWRAGHNPQAGGRAAPAPFGPIA